MYPHIEGSAVSAPVQVSYAVEGGRTITSRTAYIGTQALDGNGLIATPVTIDGTTNFDVARTDYVYGDTGELVETRLFYKALSNRKVDTSGGASAYMATTQAYYDDGRTKYVMDPSGLATYYTEGWVQDGSDWRKENRTYTVYYDSSSKWNYVGVPVQVTWADGLGRSVRGWTASASISQADNVTGSEALTELGRSVTEYDWRGRVSKSRACYDLTTPSYYDTEYVLYDNQDRAALVKSPSGDYSGTKYDLAGRAIEQWVGTSVAGTPTITTFGGDMACVSKTFYDEDGDGHNENDAYYGYVTGTATVKPNLATAPDASDNDDYVITKYSAPYATATIEAATEWVRMTMPDDGPWSVEVMDDAGRTTASYLYTENSGSLGTMLTKSTTAYDAAGRQTSSRTYSVASGTPGNYLETTYAYDDAGRLCRTASPTGLFNKTFYDAAGRTTQQFLCYDSDDTGEEDEVTDDTVITQTETVYDGNGRAFLTVSYERNHDGTGAGALTTGNAQGSYSAAWFDNAGRTVRSAFYGDNGGVAITSAASDFDPDTAGTQDYASFTPDTNGSDNIIVTEYEYESTTGRLITLTDNKDIATRTWYDIFGREDVRCRKLPQLRRWRGIWHGRRVRQGPRTA